MSAHFKKKSANTKQEIPTASLPDIIFMLLTAARRARLRWSIGYQSTRG